MTMDWYTTNALWIYWKMGDDEEVLTYDKLSNLEEENMSENNEITEVFKIEIDLFLFETPLCKAFKEFNHLLQINVDVLIGDLLGFKTCNMTYFKNYKWYEGLEDGDLKDEALKGKAILEDHGDMRIEKERIFALEEEESSEDAWNNYLPNDDNDVIQANQEWFDDHEPMEGDDDNIRDLDDYLILNNASYYIDEEEEGFKERKRKLLGMPYEKQPTSKSKKFDLIKYSLGSAEEYVAIKEYEYDIWVRTKENVS
nr:hypothetical protein [Tanacetum cinerariifolium]